jgi:phage shock protein A
MARLFRADLHAVLDRIEEPEALLKQALREMEEELAADERHHKLLAQEHAQFDTRREELEQTLRDMDGELDLCFESAKDDLARTLVKRQLETRRHAKLLAKKRVTLEKSLAELQSRLGQNRARLDAMRQKAELLAAEAGPAAEPCLAPDWAVRDEDVELALLREKQKRSRP